MTNEQISDIFDQIADLLEFQGANPFRIRAYRNGARTIRNLADSVESIIADEERRLTDIDGIGKDLAEKCGTLVHSGQLPMLDELLAEVPQSVLALLRVPRLGPKKAAVLHKELGINSLDELRAACEAGKVRQLKGFAAKTEQQILQGLDLAAEADNRFLWANAEKKARAMLAHLGACPSIERMEMAGSYRRGKETVGDLDVLVVSPDSAEVMDRFGEFPGVAEVLLRGDTKMSIRLGMGLQIDLRVVPSESFGAALQYFTGSKEHNIVLRGRAKERKLKINEYGVFRTDTDPEQYVAGAKEDEVYASLDLPCFPPELREARGEFDWAASGQLPELIDLSDICGDMHMHTTETDGRNSLEEMVAAAQDRGWSYVAITDHSKRVTMANGLNSERLLKQWEEIDRLNERLGRGFQVLKGIECDILEKGGLDLPDDVLSQADWVVVSVHYGQSQPREKITGRIVDALANPHVDILAHPTGRLLNTRRPYEVDLNAVLEAASRHGKMLELNASPQRLDLNDIHCAAAKARGIPIVISTDAHSIDQLDLMRYGILQARRAGLTKDDVANTRSCSQFMKLLRE
jgi:DNA polymerase (family 10)